MKLVIDIPEERYRLYKFKAEHHVSDAQFDLHNIIAKGKPLPKNHGRLIDVDGVIQVLHDGVFGKFDNKPQWSNVGIVQLMKDLPTIIEADSEVEKWLNIM